MNTGRLNNKDSSLAEFPINIEQVIGAKNPSLLRWIPKFIICWIKNLIHQEQINRVITSYQDDNAVEFAVHVLDELNIYIDVIGRHHLKQTERFIVASNHPLGALDGVALLKEVGQIYPKTIFPVNDILLFIPQFRNAFIPINKQGSNVVNTANLKNFHIHFANNHPILYFPAGLCSRKQKGKIKDLEWKKTLITMAIKYKRDIVPSFFEGKNSNLFYNLSNFRKWVRIKFNIELILLPREMFHQEGKRFKMIFSKPISYTYFDQRYTPAQWAHLLQSFVYTLKTGDELFESFLQQQTT